MAKKIYKKHFKEEIQDNQVLKKTVMDVEGFIDHEQETSNKKKSSDIKQSKEATPQEESSIKQPNNLKNEEDVMDKEIYETFLKESFTIIHKIETILDVPTVENFKKDMIEELYREAHTLKGNVGFFELSEIEKKCKEIEEIFREFKDEKKKFTNDDSIEIIKRLKNIKSMFNKLNKQNEIIVENEISINQPNSFKKKKENITKENLKKNEDKEDKKVVDTSTQKTDSNAETENNKDNLQNIKDTINKVNLELNDQFDDEENESEKNTERFLSFKLGKESFAFNIKHVLEIIENQKITLVPNMPVFLKGVINLRGKIIPVIDLRLLLHLPSKEYDKRTCFIIAHYNGITVGYIVDIVEEIVNVSIDHIDPPPSNIDQSVKVNYIEGLAKVGDKVKIIFDIEKSINEKINQTAS